MMYLKAELIKNLKTKFIWILSGFYIMIFILMFYQYTLNNEAGVIEPLLKESVNLYSFFIIIFTAFFNIFFSVTLGSHVASCDFSYNTMQKTVQNSGRYKPFFAKIIFLLFIASAFIIIISILGILLGLFHGKIETFNIGDYLLRCIIGIVSTFLLSLLAMLISTILKSTSRGNIFCILLLMAQNFLPFKISRYLGLLNPYYYVSSFSDKVFSNLKGLEFINFTSRNNMSALQNIISLIFYFMICLSALVFILKKREY